MDMDKFGKKVATMLDEIPLDKKIEDRLAEARKIALSKAKSNEFVEINVNEQGVLKSKFKLNNMNENIKWFILVLFGIMLITLVQLIHINEDYSQYFNDEVDSQVTSLEDQDKLSAWKEEITNLIDKEE